MCIRDSSVAKLFFQRIPSTVENSRSIVVIHGLFGNSNNFRGIFNNTQIKKRVDTWLVDLRNHGRSEHKDSMSVAEMAADVATFIEEQKLDRPLILGHSLGGRVAMNVAIRHPDILSGLIVVDTSPINYVGSQTTKETLKVIETMASVELTNRKLDDIRKELMQKLNNDKVLVSFLLTNLSPSGENCFEWRVNLNVIHKQYLSTITEPYEGQYDGPICVIGGRESTYIQESSIPAFRKHFLRFDENKNLYWIQGAGHWVHFQKPYEFLQTVTQFIDDVAKESPATIGS
eukprot:TRINITY_DN9701_c0_g1_i2.p1 TRINITY_DN9701_c0_g1~~TRINITY_DN9701_c0_g1_i2.p1  ORF type:complete len:288 (+),score=46.23 TRINITY_DN9701_c0_g1_i2:66-929(+)